MFKELTGSRVDYLLVQVDNDGQRNPIYYAEYNGGFVASNIDEATRFSDKEKALDLAKLQNQISEIMESRFKYEVVEESIERIVVLTEGNEEQEIKEPVAGE